MNFLDKIANPSNPDKPKSSNAFGVLLALAALSGIVGAMLLTQVYHANNEPKQDTSVERKLFNFSSKIAGATDPVDTASTSEDEDKNTNDAKNPTPPTNTIDDEPMPVAKKIDKNFTIRVANGSDTDGLASRYANNLKSAGFDVITVNNALSKKSKTIVYYLKGKKAHADTITKELGAPAVTLEEFEDGDISDSADVIILLGSDRTK